jgi:hypothetical protein
MAQDIESRRVWQGIDYYTTLDYLYMFLNSKLFENIFDSIMIKLDDAEIKDINFYSDLTKFDELCMTEVFEKCAEGHFLKMMRYP